MSIDTINLWHKRARPAPTYADFNVQLGCHFEEIAEMLVALEGDNAPTRNQLSNARMTIMTLAEGFKSGRFEAYASTRAEFLDSLADQVVTAIGTGHCDGFDMVEALRIVDESNWSKFDFNGLPTFNEAGKITKGPKYKAPDLTDVVGVK
jgi:hypothetical protein